jgi:hypothetical protein
VSDVKVVIVDTAVSVAVNETEAIINIGSSGPQGPRGSQVLSGAGTPSPAIGLIGDQYIDTANSYLFGPKTTSGWGEGVPLIASAPSGELGQVYNQTSPSTEWNIAHTLGFTPNIIIVDALGNVVEPSLEYLSATQIRATFSQSTEGKAYLS